MSINKLTVGTEGAVGNSRGSDLKVLTNALVSALEHTDTGLLALNMALSSTTIVDTAAPAGIPPAGAKLYIQVTDSGNKIFSNLNGTWYPTPQVVLNYILGNGQSLSIGDQGLPVVHDTDPLSGKVQMFNGLPPIGPGYEQGLVDADLASLIEFAEVSKETHSAAMFNWLDNVGALPSNAVYASLGVGGKNIEELTTTTGASWGIANTNKVIDKMIENGDFDIPFTTWIHGEANSVTADPSYKTYLRNYHNGMQTRSGKTFPMIIDQTGKSSSVNIGEVLLQYAEENADCFMAGPKYWLNRLYPEATGLRLHLNAQGYMLQGEMMASCIASVLDGEDFKPVSPLSIEVLPNSGYKKLRVTFHVPHSGNLVEDTTTLPAAPAMGFTVRGLDDQTPAAPDTAVINGNYVDLTLSEPVTTESIIALGGSLDDRADTDNVLLPCTNLRSDVAHSSLYVAGETWYDWSVQFKRLITGGLNRAVDNLWLHGDFAGTLTANETGAGRGAEWLLDDVGDVILSYDVTRNSGQLFIWVYNTRTIVSATSSDVITIPANAVRRMSIQAGSGGFDGTASISIVKA